MKMDSKVLVVAGLEEELERWIREQAEWKQPIVLKCQGPVILEPYDSLARSVIYKAHDESIREIVLLGLDGSVSNSNAEPASSRVRSRIQQMNNAKTVEYMLRHRPQGFRTKDLDDWISAGDSAASGIERSTEMLRNHPLLPSGVQVRGMLVPAGAASQ